MTMSASLSARIASNERWARPFDRTEATSPAREAMQRRFAQEVIKAAEDAGVTLSDEDIARRAKNARTAHYLRMARKSVEARAAKKASEAL
jgi:hypothetical protein